MTKENITLDEITIRNKFLPGDIGYIVYLHGLLYSREYNHGLGFEAYVAAGLADLFHNFDAQKDRAWICEHDGRVIGSLFLQHRDRSAQLRYFLIHPRYRGIGLGKKLINQYMSFLRERKYPSSFLWTSHELEKAAAIYKHHGFVLTEEKPSSRFGKPLKEQKYEWTSRTKQPR